MTKSVVIVVTNDGQALAIESSFVLDYKVRHTSACRDDANSDPFKLIIIQWRLKLDFRHRGGDIPSCYFANW